MNSFFISGECSDPGYRNVRDGAQSPLLVECRAFTESLWARYAPLADSHFREDARAHFIERFWEMYLGVAFLDRGFQVSPGSGTGPDFSFNDGGRRFWVEAVAPGPGTGPDRVPEIENGVAYEVPTEKILLRFASAVIAKREQYHAALEAGIVSPDNGYLLAINSRRIPHAPYGNTLPFYVQALLPFGNLTLMLNRSTREIEDRFYQAREKVLKGNSAPVSTQPFLNPDFAFVSAVLHSAVDCVNRPEHLGGDFSVLHNPLAACPLNPSTFAWCDQYFYREGVLEKLSGRGDR
jgi:type I restriction enzyme S subunit